MRFSPRRNVSMATYDDTAYDSPLDYDDDDSSSHSTKTQGQSISLEYTPSKSFTGRIVGKRYTSSPSLNANISVTSVLNSIPSGSGNGSGDESMIVDQLSELLGSHSIKERYDSIRTVKSQGRLKVRSRPSSVASNSSNTSLLTAADLSQSSNDDELLLQEVQSSVVSGLEQRLRAREQNVALRLKEIQEEKRRIEEERKRKEEEERRRLEEERKRKEEEERKRKEEEARLKKEEEERKALEEKKAKEEALKKKQEDEKKAAEKKAKEEAALKKKLEEEALAAKRGQGQTNFKAIEEEFIKYKNKIQDIKTNIVEKVKSNPDLKKLIMKHKRKINPKFGQLTNSLSQLSRITSELVQMINETKPDAMAYSWILNFTAKAIISQSETEVRVKPASSIPLANLALNLICEFPELLEFLKARFIKKCPLVIGYTCSIATEEGRLRMGWKRNEDKKWEDEITYDERMAGMMTLYCVITRLPLSQPYFQSKKHPLPMAENWKFIARILNTPLELITNVHFIVVNAWWDSSALQFSQTYGAQGVKILNLVYGTWCDEVMKLRQSSGNGGGAVFAGLKTLKTIGEEWTERGSLKEFESMEP